MTGLLRKRAVALLVLCMTGIFLLTACSNGATKTTNAAVFDPKALEQEIAAATDSSGNPLFEEAARPEDTELRDVYNIDPDLFADSILLVDKNYSLCMMIKPADGKSNDVKNMMSTSLEQLAQQLELYQPKECQKVRDHLETLRGDYLIYAACADNDKLVELIEKAME